MGHGGAEGAESTGRWSPVRGGLGSQAPDLGRYGEADECCLTYGGVTGAAYAKLAKGPGGSLLSLCRVRPTWTIAS